MQDVCPDVETVHGCFRCSRPHLTVVFRRVSTFGCSYEWSFCFDGSLESRPQRLKSVSVPNVGSCFFILAPGFWSGMDRCGSVIRATSRQADRTWRVRQEPGGSVTELEQTDSRGVDADALRPSDEHSVAVGLTWCTVG